MKQIYALRIFLVLMTGVVVVSGIGCAKDVPELDIEESAAAVAAAAPAGRPGIVLETMNAANYTYVRVDVGGEEIWAAGPQTTVAVGDHVIIPPGSPMQDFHSESMDRTFDLIYFVDRIVPEGGGAVAQGMPPGHPPMNQADPAAPETVSGVEKVAGGFTIAEVYSRKAELAGNQVTLRGQVVKVNRGILGSNWLHIQDGTGDAGDGTNDLTVTTAGLAEVGQTVVAAGVLELDKDFGAGYRYAAIVTDAQVTIE